MAEAQGGKEGAKIKLPPNQKQKQIPLSQLSREDLEARVRQLEAHNTQLRNLLSKSQTGSSSDSSTHGKSLKQRDFDFSKYSRRHVALKLCYLGWDYQGFTVQEDSHNTIEAQLFAALLKTKLIESRETSNYHRCGRTDKGVSAFDQVISITLRSKVRKGIGVEGVSQEDSSTTDRLKENEKQEEEEEEINYIQLLNRVLPQEIRILAWCPVPSEFSARFDCRQRTYKYFFPQGSLDLQAMGKAGQHLVGEHDFRNLCKMDVANGVVNFRRRIMAVKVARVDEEIDEDAVGDGDDGVVHERNNDSDGYEMCVATIEGQAFLWHQVRSVMAVLFLVGQGKEQPDVVAELLDIKTHPRKPQYCLASDLPLNLWAVHFDGIVWRWDEDELQRLLAQLQELWTQQAVRNTMTRSMLKDLEIRYEKIIRVKEKRKGKREEKQPENNEPEVKKIKMEEEKLPRSHESEMKIRMEEEDEEWKVKKQPTVLMSSTRCKVYRPLLSRPTCESLEKRVEHYIKKQRLDPDLLKKIN